MATEVKDGPAEPFLDLIKREKFREAAAQFAELVRQLKCEKLVREQEQEFRLRPTKAFKRFCKFFKRDDAIHGLLAILERSPSDGDVVIRALYAISTSSFGAQVASCENSASAFRQYGAWLFAPMSSPVYRPRHRQEVHIFEHVIDYVLLLGVFMQMGPPSFIKGAFEQQLLQQIFASFPWGQALSASKYCSELDSFAMLAHFTALTVGEFLKRGERSEVPLSALTPEILAPWVVAFFDELRRLSELIDVASGFWDRARVVNHMEVCGGILFHHLHEMALLNQILQLPQGPSFERAARSLLSSLSTPEAKTQGGALVANMQYIQLQRGAQTRKNLNDFPAIRVLLQRIREGSGTQRREGLLRLLKEVNGGTVSALQIVLVQCDVVSCLIEVVREEAGANLEMEMGEGCLTRALELLSLFLGLADMSDSSAVRVRGEFDRVGACLLEIGERVITRLGQNLRHFWEALVFCYNSGSALQERRTELIGLVVRGLDSLTPDRWASALGWHFLTVLTGICPLLSGSGFGVQPENVGPPSASYASKYGVQFRARHRPVDEADATRIMVAQGSEIARVVLHILNQFRVSHELHGAYPSSAALILELLCRHDSGLMKEQVLGKVGLLVEVLEVVYSESAPSFSNRRGASEPVEQINEEQRAGLCSALTEIVARCLALEGASDEVIRDVALNKGVLLCQRVLRSKRVIGSAFVTPTELPFTGLGERPLAEKLEELVEGLWEKIAVTFDLKECSNPDCQKEILEVVKRTFRKCSACGTVQYCSRDCQLAHWRKAHKVICKPLPSQQPVA